MTAKSRTTTHALCADCGTRKAATRRGNLCRPCWDTHHSGQESPRILTGGQWVKGPHGIHTWTPDAAREQVSA